MRCMFLKRLEINGFKSFAGKTVFEFPTGIVGIVGPNGSGKSNVIDAVRWLLGEREAKNLRGEKIEDLIFAGTPKKPKMSMAQVSLVFDNSSGQLPLDYKEIVISRKINRTGESDYFINDAAVRLKDIIDFFSKIKLGTRGLTIIGQGSGDIFVKATPAQRMMMVQEILGLREFQIKKAESQRKLKNTKINLEKVRAMIAEVAPRLRMLKRQTVKWEKRFEVEQELMSMEGNFYASKIKNLKDSLIQVKQPLPVIEKKLKESENLQKELEEKLKKIENSSLTSKKVSELQQNKRELFSKKSQLERELYRIESQLERFVKTSGENLISIERAKETLDEIKDNSQKAIEVNSLEETKSYLKIIIHLVENLYKPKDVVSDKDFDNLKKEKERVVGILEKIEQEIEEIEKNENDISKSVEDFNKNFKEVFTQVEEARKLSKNLWDEKSRLMFEEERVHYKLEELKNQIHSFGDHFNKYEELADSQSFIPDLSGDNLIESERKIFRLRGELASIGEIDESLVKETHEVEAHHDFLVKESDDLERACENLFSLINELDKKITYQFHLNFKKVNEEFNNFFRLMFGGGSAKMKVIEKEVSDKIIEGEESEEIIIEKDEDEVKLAGIDVELSIPQKKINNLEMLSGGEKSLVSIAVLFALIAVSPPPFLILDEADSALDEKNSKRFADLIKNFSGNSQFIVVTHNRVTMEVAQILYGVTMDDSGSSKVLSLKLEDAKKAVR